MFRKSQWKAEKQEARDIISTLATFVIKLGLKNGVSETDILNDEIMVKVKDFMDKTNA